MKKVLISIINFYQIFVSIIIKNILGIDKMCKFSPTCSEYAKITISKNGIVTGIGKSTVRILKCQSFLSVS